MNYSFWAAAAGIALVDIVLSGDNAIVIGAAASRLRGPQRMIAILFGGLGAIVLRLALASAATTLLLVPYLRIIGGVVVFLIGVRLLLPESDRTRNLARGGMFAAMLTIVIADITMSLDNVIAVGALAEGHVGLLVAGITFSMVLLFVASSIIARLVEHMQWLMDLAAAVLAWTAANLILGDPTVTRVVHLSGRLESALHFYAVGLMLLIDLLIRAVQHHRASRAARAGALAAAANGELDEMPAVEEREAPREGVLVEKAAPEGDGSVVNAPAPASGANARPPRHPAQARRPLH
ncbi:MAG TPA: YjbE family putative metal transport protein [Ktedonobacterales bacterium]|nr:YjbE family putative metal transport protein [Ktedonobacterales bacterium]